MGISADYYTAVPLDPPDHQLNLYIDALMGLTPQILVVTKVPQLRKIMAREVENTMKQLLVAYWGRFLAA